MNATRGNPPGLEQSWKTSQSGCHRSLCSNLKQTARRTGLHPAQAALEWPTTRQSKANTLSTLLRQLVRALSQRGAGPDTVWGLTQGPAEKPDSEQACAATTGRLGGRGLRKAWRSTGYLLWGEEEAISGPLSSINSRMESGWSHWLRNQPCFLNTHGWPRPFNPQTPQGSCRKKTSSLWSRNSTARV